MTNLKRHLAPITDEMWNFIDDEAREILASKLNARKVVNFEGPKGLDFAAVNTGRREDLTKDLVDGVSYSKRHVLPLVELEVPFTLELDELESLTRGAEDVDTAPLIEAAEKVAKAENEAVLKGLDEANIKGILAASEHEAVAVEDDLVAPVVEATKKLVAEGIKGPYNLLLGSDLYSLLYESKSNKGYPVKRRITNLIEGNIIYAPSLEGKGLLLPQDSEDFEFVSGQDISIGFSEQNGNELDFFFTESFTFRVNAPEAAVVLD
ncbi:family 1 encapsulin nanocompartment shell protein [Halanaerobacter jeridensis]|uniref:Type 1 encapsulin shell protein n=1 Tax=Halanaerobacter jeridensis TaxID=706427 RepID=A0A939BMA1_9FIRM|nr:family 1 encapsulin nanocompartment shell protein [Halanaerobacter jeridensis]MBM7555905.1 putative linocin/CFP29 family protein [Halanaerobacter jeridensis]